MNKANILINICVHLWNKVNFMGKEKALDFIKNNTYEVFMHGRDENIIWPTDAIEAIEIASRPDNPPTVRDQVIALLSAVVFDEETGDIAESQTINKLNKAGYFITKVTSNELRDMGVITLNNIAE